MEDNYNPHLFQVELIKKNSNDEKILRKIIKEIDNEKLYFFFKKTGKIAYFNRYDHDNWIMKSENKFNQFKNTNKCFDDNIFYIIRSFFPYFP